MSKKLYEKDFKLEEIKTKINSKSHKIKAHLIAIEEDMTSERYEDIKESSAAIVNICCKIHELAQAGEDKTRGGK